MCLLLLDIHYFCSRLNFFTNFMDILLFFIEEMEMKLGSVNTSPINNSTSTIDTQGDNQRSHNLSSRVQSSRTLLTEVAT